MTHPIRVAVKIQRITDADGRETLKATLPVGVLFEKSFDPPQLEAERVALERKYVSLIETLKAKRAEMKTGNVLRYWEFGDAIARFEQDENSALLFVEKLNEHLSRDVGLSIARLWACKTLRGRISDPSRVDPAQNITNYQRANFDPARLPRIARRRGRPRKIK